MATYRYHHPPNWPEQPKGWKPGPGWTRPADWPEPPPFHVMWQKVPFTRTAAGSVVIIVIAVVAFLIFIWLAGALGRASVA